MRLPLHSFFFLAVCLLTLITVQGQAQTPQYFTMGGTSNNSFPLNTASSNKVQWVYTPADFPTAPSGSITHIFLYAGSTPSGTPTYSNFTVKMGTTTLSTFTSGAFQTGLNTVYASTTQTFTGVANNTWVQIPLQTSFFWNNTQNFIVEISQTSYSSGFSLRQNTAGGNKRLYGGVASATGTAGTGLLNFGFNIVTGPPCIVPTALNSSNVTMNSADFNWTAPTTTTGYEYAITTTATPPASGTAIATTSYNATGLTGGTNYWFHVRNVCSSTNFSPWVTTSFATLPCPSAGAPIITTNTPGTVTFSWPGSSNPGVASYQYSITTSATAPTTWSSTAATTVTVSSLIPGVTYYAHVRSNCAASNSFSPWLNVQFFNPFPPCFTPDSIDAYNINMHGATISWNAALNAVGYQYAVTTSAVPPATGTPIIDTFVDVTNLTPGTTYYTHVRTHCGTTNYSPWITDSFVTSPNCLAPLTPVVSNVTSSTAEVSWKYYPGIYGYEYFVSTNLAPPNFPGIALNYHIYYPANLNSGTTYYIHVRTRCDSINYSPWSTASFTTVEVCTAPSTPVVTSLTTNQVSFSWSPVAAATSYEYALTTDASPPAFGAFTSLTTHNLADLVPGTSYFYHLRAYCSESDVSSWKTVNFTTHTTSVSSIINENEFSLDAYPNPVTETLNVRVTGKLGKFARIQLVDITGKLVQTEVVTDDNFKLNISNFTPGMYLLKYVDSENAGVIRIEKQ